MANFVEKIHQEESVELDLLCMERREMEAAKWDNLNPFYQYLAKLNPGHEAHFQTTGMRLGPVVLKINGRVVNAGDAEHCACKLKIILCNTYVARTISGKPQASRHYYHPLPLSSIPWNDTLVKGHMRTARSAFDALPDKQLPDVCRMVHEFKNTTEESANEAESDDSNDDKSEDEQSEFSGSTRD
jgi:hypothetical protein